MKKLFFVLSSLLLLGLSYNMAYSYENAGIGAKASEDGYLLALAQDAKNYVTKENTVFVDTRAKDAFAAKHVKGSVNLSLAEVANNLKNGAFNGKNVFLLYNGGTKGGVKWEGIDIIGAIGSVLLYGFTLVYNGIPMVVQELLTLVLEQFAGIDIDYNQPIPGLPALDGNLLGMGDGASDDKDSSAFNSLSGVISAAKFAGFKGAAIPLSAFENAIFESNR
jgi:rhodanese-related sulfurtransferase